ncbi:hypothetical protein TEQG_06687 [Trichophyton equinum CBS 127.97]|uniref:General transcription and DNA repair factor IIH subunit TFB5 n=1 Tax=Trichophyton equinum (strain ATCC MYA-4606 / CBS 127.97) TaxID=559882 RepID=F2Q0N6_TRIEC|nr:hypothetical protein TEQG_06687 [Trichophyton equinum CBS 127.97]
MPRAVKGVLIECDPSVKAIILKYDRLQNNEYIVEDLEGDDRYLVVKESQLASLKIRLAKAWIFTANSSCAKITNHENDCRSSTENLCNQKNPSQSNWHSSTALRTIHWNPLLHPGWSLSNNVSVPRNHQVTETMTTHRNYSNNPPETPECSYLINRTAPCRLTHPQLLSMVLEICRD